MKLEVFPIINLVDQLHTLNQTIKLNIMDAEAILWWLNQYGEVIISSDSSTFVFKSRFGFHSLHYFTIDDGHTAIKLHHWI